MTTHDETRRVVEAYFTAWTTKRTDEAYALLAPDLHFAGPSAEYKTAEEFKPGLVGFAAMTKGARVLQLQVDGDRAAMLYDCDLPPPAGTLRIASFFRVQNGRIREYDTRFDATEFRKLQRKAMRGDPETVSLAYLSAVGNKRFGELTELFASNLSFSGPGGALARADDFIQALRSLAPVLVRNDVKRTFVDGDDVCVWYDFVTDTPVGIVPTVERLHVANGRIDSIHLIFDASRWPVVVEEAKRRASK
jgi:hypothetical protein